MYNLFECSDDETYEISSDLVCASVDQELYTVHPLYGEHSSLLSMEKAIGFYLQNTTNLFLHWDIQRLQELNDPKRNQSVGENQIAGDEQTCTALADVCLCTYIPREVLKAPQTWEFHFHFWVCVRSPNFGLKTTKIMIFLCKKE